MKSWFSLRGYPHKLTENETSKVKFSGQRVFHRKKFEKGVSVGKIIYDKLYLLHMNEELKDLSTPGPIVSFRSSRKINRYLVRAKLHPVKISVGSFSFNEKFSLTYAQNF